MGVLFCNELLILDVLKDSFRAFHPNDQGHRKIADRLAPIIG